MELRLRAEDKALWEAAFDVARRFRGFGSYGSGRKACQALRRRWPGLGLDEYPEVFRQAVHLYDQALDVIGRHIGPLSAYWAALHTGTTQSPPEGLERLRQEIDNRLHECCPGIPLPVCRQAADWVFYWHHLR